MRSGPTFVDIGYGDDWRLDWSHFGSVGRTYWSVHALMLLHCFLKHSFNVEDFFSWGCRVGSPCVVGRRHNVERLMVDIVGGAWAVDRAGCPSLQVLS